MICKSGLHKHVRGSEKSANPLGNNGFALLIYIRKDCCDNITYHTHYRFEAIGAV